MQTVTKLDNGNEVYSFKTLTPDKFTTSFSKRKTMASKIFIKYNNIPVFAVIKGTLKRIEEINDTKVYIILSMNDEATYNASIKLDNFAYNAVKDKVPNAFENYVPILIANEQFRESGLIKTTLCFDEETGISDALIIENTSGEEASATIKDLNKYLKCGMEIFVLLEIRYIEIGEISKLNLNIKQIRYKENKIKEQKLLTSLPYSDEKLSIEKPNEIKQSEQNVEIKPNVKEQKNKTETSDIKIETINI